MLKIHEPHVKRIMYDRGIVDQKDLAVLADISEQTLIRLFRGKPFSSKTLEQLAGALDCNPVDLMNVGDFPAPLVVAPATA